MLPRIIEAEATIFFDPDVLRPAQAPALFREPVPYGPSPLWRTIVHMQELERFKELLFLQIVKNLGIPQSLLGQEEAANEPEADRPIIIEARKDDHQR